MPADEVIWCEAFLTNAPELAAVLECEDENHSALVRLAVERLGDQAPAYMRGAWAYARRIGEATVIVRDPLGLMPAFWARDARGVVHVSDSLSTLAMVDGVDGARDEQIAFAERLNTACLYPERTAARGIRRVPPGSAATISGDGHEVNRWWRPEDVPRAQISFDEAVKQLRTLLDEVMRDHVGAMLRDSPTGTLEVPCIGAHATGGLDSTALALMANALLAKEDARLAFLACWSPAPDAVDTETAEGGTPLPFDERELLTRLADEVGAPLLFGPVETRLAPWAAELDPATFPAVTFMRESHILPQAAALGARHIISGWGGDEFASFNGRGTIYSLFAERRWRALPAAYSVRRRAGLGPIKSVRHVAASAVPGRWRRTDPLIPTVLLGRRSRLAWANYEAHPQLVLDALASWHAVGRPRTAHEIQLGLLANGHLSERTESWYAAGQRFGVRYHFPLLDIRIVEWALSLPPEVLMPRPSSRALFRAAIADVVPEWVLKGSKMDPVLIRVQTRERAAQGSQLALEDMPTWR